MKYLLTLFLFILIIFTCNSQNERENIKGTITHFETPVQDIHIVNITSNRGTISDSNGQFEIEVKVNDILFDSHIEYMSKKITIKQINIEKGQLKIYIVSHTNYLDTVEIKNHSLTGDLVEDLKNSPKDTLPQMSITPMEFMKLAAMPSMKIDFYEINLEKPIMNNVDPTAGGVGASIGIAIKDKENILRRKLRVKKSIPDKMISDFGKSYFIDELGIQEEEIHLFITYCESQGIFKLYKERKILELLTVFRKESKSSIIK